LNNKIEKILREKEKLKKQNKKQNALILPSRSNNIK